jgi:hypothetical protein
MITSTKISRIQDKIKSMIKEIEKEEEVKITFGTCRYSTSEYNTTMKVETNAKDEKTLNTVNSANEGLSKAYGFKSNIIGKTFMSRGQKHTIVEFKTRNRKYPIISECGGTGAKYKHTTSTIQSYLK